MLFTVVHDCRAWNVTDRRHGDTISTENKTNGFELCFVYETVIKGR